LTKLEGVFCKVWCSFISQYRYCTSSHASRL